MSEQDKIYVDGVWIKEFTFPSTGNTILKVGVKADELIAFLNKHKDDGGYVNLGISRRQKPSDKGITHTVWLDTWKPDKKREAASTEPKRAQHHDEEEQPF